MKEQYILPRELAALLAFLVAPPLIIALGVESWIFVSRGLFRPPYPARVIIGYVVTTCMIVITSTILVLAGPSALSALGVRDVFLKRVWLPVLPVAFVVAAAVAPVVILWVGQRADHQAALDAQKDARR